MPFKPEIHHRRSIRLQGYDYSQAGAYFFTLCSQNRECLLGEIVEGKMRLNAAGDMVRTAWNEIPNHYPGVDVAEFVVMPNHIHGIIVIETIPRDCVGAAPRGRPVPVPPHGHLETIPRDCVGAAPRGRPVPVRPVPVPPLGHLGPPGQEAHGSGQARGPAPTEAGHLSLPDVVHRFKTMTTKLYADGVKQQRWPSFAGRLWQRNYWEHVIRDEADFLRIRQYIQDNPAQWEQDSLNQQSAHDLHR